MLYLYIVFGLISHKDVEVKGQGDAHRVFDIKAIVHFEFLPQGQTVNQYVYKEILRRLRRSVRDKRWDLWENNAWVLYHDNAPSHSALSIQQFLAERNVSTLEQPPYSPDLAPCDFFLIPKLKGVIKGTRFPGVEAIKRAMTMELRLRPSGRDDFDQQDEM